MGSRHVQQIGRPVHQPNPGQAEAAMLDRGTAEFPEKGITVFSVYIRSKF